MHTTHFLSNPPATTEIYTLSLHDALPILFTAGIRRVDPPGVRGRVPLVDRRVVLDAGVQYEDRKSTRLNSSHVEISYAVFCLKKKKHLEIHHVQAQLDRLREPVRGRAEAG